jgi:diguanylate cyclase (GGDEF)-like protein
MIILDVRTLFVAIAIVSLYMSLLLFLYSRGQKTYPGFGFWLAGNVLALIMYSLYSLRGIVPDLFSIIIANSIGTLANVLRLEGMKKFFTKGARLWLPNFSLPVIVFITHAYFRYVIDNLPIRDLIFSAIIVIVVARMIWLLIFDAGEDTKPVSLFFAALMIIFAAGLGLRVLSWHLTGTTSLLANNEINSTSVLFLLIFDVSWSVCLILLNSLRMNNEISTLTSQLEQLASIDALTGVYNRRKFLETGDIELERAKRYGKHLSLIMFDLNNFKVVNDTYGHATGDEVLKKVVEICRKNLRRQDVIGRFGGDEFVILMPETNLAAAIETANRLNNEIQNTDHEWIWQVNLSLSYGAASATTQDTALEQLIHRADILLYDMKKSKSLLPASTMQIPML